jgi:hypothetical protein
VTTHAVARYVEHVGGSHEAAVAALSSAGIQTAATFGARVVRLNGVRVLMRFCEGRAFVTTVVPQSHMPQQLMPHASGGPPPSIDELSPFHPPLETAHG